MNLREAAQQALAVFENPWAAKPGGMLLAIDSLRAALAEDAVQRLTDEQQEMKATIKETRHHRAYRMLKEAMDSDRENIIKNMPDFDFHTEVQKRYEPKISAFDTATIKDNLTVEPVAYVTGFSKGYATVQPIDPCLLMPVGMALYRSPPKREPLTNNEM